MRTVQGENKNISRLDTQNQKVITHRDKLFHSAETLETIERRSISSANQIMSKSQAPSITNKNEQKINYNSHNETND